MSTIQIASVDQLCKAVENVLATHLTATMTALGWVAPEYDPVETWQQVPTIAALSSANLPAGAIVSPGLVEPPSRRPGGGHEATWRIPVGIYARGEDHDETAARIRNWCAGIRLTVLQHKSLGGHAKSLAWRGEEYAQVPDRNAARTLAAGAVAFDVTATMLPPGIPPTGLPLVTQTPTQLSVQ